MYADKKGWDVDRIDLEVSIHIDKTETGQVSNIVSHIVISGQVTTEQKNRMLEIARKCPLYRLLTNPVNISTNLIDELEL
jgi:putative redox protein